jgi:hypothetical protein
VKTLLQIVLIAFLTANAYSQKYNTKYYSLSEDTLLVDHFLTFKNDSIVQISSVPRTMWHYFEKNLKYIKKGNKIYISADDSLQLKKYGFQSKKELIIEGHALTNASQREVYVIRQDFDKYPDLILHIGDKEYSIDMGKSDSYGLIIKKPKQNKRLQRSLKQIDFDKYDATIIKGFSAYRKYGYKYVFGVVELNMK